MFSWEAGHEQKRAAGPPGSCPCPFLFLYFLPVIGSNHVTWLACLVEKQDTNTNELLDPLVLVLVPLYSFISCLWLDQIMSHDWHVQLRSRVRTTTSCWTPWFLSMSLSISFISCLWLDRIMSRDWRVQLRSRTRTTTSCWTPWCSFFSPSSSSSASSPSSPS